MYMYSYSYYKHSSYKQRWGVSSHCFSDTAAAAASCVFARVEKRGKEVRACVRARACMRGCLHVCACAWVCKRAGSRTRAASELKSVCSYDESRMISRQCNR